MECENCGANHAGDYGSGRFCSSKCSRGFATKAKRAEINEKVSRKLAGRPTSSCGTRGSSGVLHTPDVKRKARDGRIAYYASLPFEALGKDGKRKRIIEEQGGACNHCGIIEWRGSPITLELEHRDGNNQNDTRENLECICPNCHSQTATWRGRNKARKKNVTDEQLAESLRKTRSMHKTLLEFGFSPKGNNYIRIKRIADEFEVTCLNTGGVYANNAKLSEEQVTTVRERLAEGHTQKSIAEEMGVGRHVIGSVARGQTYLK